MGSSNYLLVATDAASEDEILAHEGNTLGVDGQEVSILEEGDEESLRSLLESKNGSALEAEIVLEVVGDFTNEALEGELADEEVSGLLVAANLTKSDGTGAVAVRLLDTTGGGGGLAGSLVGKRLARGLATDGLTSGLLGTSHFGLTSLKLSVEKCDFPETPHLPYIRFLTSLKRARQSIDLAESFESLESSDESDIQTNNTSV